MIDMSILLLSLIVPLWGASGALTGSYIGTIESRVRVGIPIKTVKKTRWSPGDFEPWYFCFKCKHPLRIKDMLPIISYLLNKGRCHHCKAKYTTETLRWECKGLILGPLMLLVYLRKARRLTT